MITLLSWNMKQKASNGLTILDSNIDAALLQEAKAPPTDMRTEFLLDREGNWYEPKFYYAPR